MRGCRVIVLQVMLSAAGLLANTSLTLWVSMHTMSLATMSLAVLHINRIIMSYMPQANKPVLL